MRLTCLLGCGLELERFEDVRSVQLVRGEKGLMEFEGRGEKVEGPEGRGGSIDEETALVVRDRRRESVTGSVRGKKCNTYDGLQYL